jgi:hypothetical protein
MPPVGFKCTIPASARPQTYALDRAATGIGKYRFCETKTQKEVKRILFRQIVHQIAVSVKNVTRVDQRMRCRIVKPVLILRFKLQGLTRL